MSFVIGYFSDLTIFKEGCDFMDFGYNPSDCGQCDNAGVWSGSLYVNGNYRNEIIFALDFAGSDCTMISGIILLPIVLELVGVFWLCKGQKIS